MGYFVQRWSDEFSTNVSIFGGRAMSRFGPVYVGLEGAANLGKTREVAAAYKAITNDPVVDQNIVQVGARAVVRVDYPVQRARDERKPGDGYLEVDFASRATATRRRARISRNSLELGHERQPLDVRARAPFQSARGGARGPSRRDAAHRDIIIHRRDRRAARSRTRSRSSWIDFRPHEDVLIAQACSSRGRPSQSWIRWARCSR
ncbi:MAG: hypothetical protein U0271_11125 [Polyangiaceae bacterium]